MIGAYLIERFGSLNGGVAFLPEQIQQSLTAKLNYLQIGQSQTDELPVAQKQQSLTAKSPEAYGFQDVASVSRDGFAMSLADGRVKAVPQMVFNRLSFTHIVELLHVNDDLQRTFYAVEAMRGPWSVRELDYSDVAQMQLYMSYYREHIMREDDNPPVGLLLCTEYGQEMVEYLAPFTDPQLFVARYELELPSKEKIKEFLLRENTGK